MLSVTIRLLSEMDQALILGGGDPGPGPVPPPPESVRDVPEYPYTS